MKNLYYKILICALLLLGFFLRVYMIGNNSYTGDEARLITWCCGANFLWQGAHPPLYRILLAGWIRVFGTQEMATKMLSVIFGTFALLFIYLIGKKLGGRRVGLFALYLGTISPLLVLFSRSIEVFSCFLFFNLGSTWLFLLAIKDTNKLWMYVFVTILNLYAGTFAVFTLLCQWIWLLMNSKKIDKLKWVLSYLIILLASSFWIIELFKIAPTELGGPNRVPASLLAKLGYLGFSFSLGQTILPWNFKLAIPGIFIYIIVTIYGIRTLIKRKWIKEISFLLIFTLIPLLPVATNINFPHYYLGVASLYYIFLSLGIGFLRTPLKVVGLILITGFNIYGIRNIYLNREYHLQRFTDDWRGVTEIIKSLSDPDTKVVAYHPSFIWYYSLSNLVVLNEPQEIQTELAGVKKTIFVHTPLSGGFSVYEQKGDKFKEWLDDDFSLAQVVEFCPNEDYEIKRKILAKPFPRFRIQVFIYERRGILG